MTSADPPSPYAAWRDRLEGPDPDHARFVGPPLPIEGLTPRELGRLVPALRRAIGRPGAVAEAAWALRRGAEEAGLEPVFEPEPALQALRMVAPGAWGDVIHVLARLASNPADDLRVEVRRQLDEAATGPDPALPSAPQAVLVARLAGVEIGAGLHDRLAARHGTTPLARAEFALLPTLGSDGLLALAGAQSYFQLGPAGTADAAPALADEPAYVAFAQASLHEALARIDAIHAGRESYRADAAFEVADAHRLALCARVAAWRDEPWYRALIGRLLPGVAVAPGAAKTLPSQSLAIALGHSVEAVPTPEGVQALREAVRAVRHAGVRKKIERNLKPAERALAARAEVALRVATTVAKPDRKVQAMVGACLEAGWWQGLRWSAPQWLAQIAEPANGRPFATGLVWTHVGADGHHRPLLMEADGPAKRFVDAEGRGVEQDPDATLQLWHPLDAGADERAAWRAALLKRRLRQPLRQVFREIYPPAVGTDAVRSEAFAGHTLSIRTLLGLARREGWRIDKWNGLVRRFGAVRATFQVGADLFPRLDGHCDSGALLFEQERAGGWQLRAIGSIDAVVHSEVSRAVDLLVSVSAFALDGDERPGRIEHLASLPLSAMARHRRDTLAMVFAEPIAQGRVVLDDRHLRVGPYAVHLATARITRGGEAVELPAASYGARLAALPWLPYDEVLLQRIADAVGTLLATPA